jgi:hypothetical protein
LDSEGPGNLGTTRRGEQAGPELPQIASDESINRCAVARGNPGKLSVTGANPKLANSVGKACPDAFSMFATPVAVDSSSLR